MTPRRAAVLAMNLPAGAQTWVAAGSDAAWSSEAHLTAAVFDAVNVGNWQRTGDKNAKKPQPAPRPSDARRSAATADRNEIRARAFQERQKRLQQPQEV